MLMMDDDIMSVNSMVDVFDLSEFKAFLTLNILRRLTEAKYFLKILRRLTEALPFLIFPTVVLSIAESLLNNLHFQLKS